MGGHRMSVIVTSYNQPNALRLVLASFAAQEDLDFELIIADDGSDEDVRQHIAALVSSVPFPVKFITQPRNGFRKARICNLAILAAEGEQLLFCDGDSVALPGHIMAHKRHFRPWTFCAGGRIRADLAQSSALTPEAIVQGKVEALMTLGDRLRLRWIDFKNALYSIFDVRDKPKFFGGNFSASREDLIAIDGFDEAYNGISGVDSDLRNRLRNYGCKGISLWRRSVICHLDHALDPRRCTAEARRERRIPDLYYGSFSRVKALRGISSLQA